MRIPSPTPPSGISPDSLEEERKMDKDEFRTKHVRFNPAQSYHPSHLEHRVTRADRQGRSGSDYSYKFVRLMTDSIDTLYKKAGGYFSF